MNSVYDVAVVGAGPAGASAAAFMARAGLRVLLLEKERFPRFHIGESLLPLGIETLVDLGIHLEQEPFALHKAGARILCEQCHQEHRISFTETLPGVFPYAFQVDRAEFDLHLANRAAELGADLRFECPVQSFTETDDWVLIESGQASFRARYLLDATGQLAITAKKQGRQWIHGLGHAATFSHFHDPDPELYQHYFGQGDILVLLHRQRSWGWVIPLPEQRLSVGLVQQKEGRLFPPAQAFQTLLEHSPLLQRLLAPAQRVEPIRRVANFSYYHRQPQSRRWASFGDARAFLDPVFSSGVSLALHAGRRLAQHLLPQLEQDRDLDLEDYAREMERGYRVFERLLERFYRPGWAHNTFFFPDKPEDWVRQLNTILAGDVWRDDNPWQNRMLCGRRRTIKVS